MKPPVDQEIDGTIKAISQIFNARSLAVVGASNDQKKFGGMTLNTILQAGYTGRLYPVNPKATEIQGLKSYSSLLEISDPIDLVLIIVPAGYVPDIIIQTGEKKAKGAVIMSAGFREAGRPDLEEAALKAARSCGIRVLGPNIQGFNYLPNKLCAMFLPVIDTPGPVAIISQSGSVTTILSEWASDEGVGIAAAVNLGNQIDLCEKDYLRFFAEDNQTKAIAMYLESVTEGKGFMKALKETTSIKPVCILKGGQTEEGLLSAMSHTGAVAGKYEIFNTACIQSGGAVAPDLETLYDQAKALAALNRLSGRNVVIISSSGGANSIAVDEGVRSGFRFPRLPSTITKTLSEAGLPSLSKLENPIDLGSVFGRDYLLIAEIIDKHRIADLILFNFADPVFEASEVVIKAADELETPVAVSLMGAGSEESTIRRELSRRGIAVFSSPTRAFKGLRAAAG